MSSSHLVRILRASAGGLLLLSAVPALAAEAAAPPTCFGQAVTMTGTGGDDVLVGRSDVRDVIYAGDGDDVVRGGDFYDVGSEPDLLCGGPGDDYVSGSPGDDRLNGGDGDDKVDGGNGADVERGNAGNDNVGQGSFADSDDAADLTRGGRGRDVLAGGSGRDALYGGPGPDTLTDLECDGPGILDGGLGDDRLESWSSSLEGYTEPCAPGSVDTVTGGAGRDTAKVDRGDSVSAVERLTRVG